jgi:uncharacterized protein (TIGR02217 family)
MSAMSGGPTFSTDVIVGANGQEVRNANWQDPLWSWNATSTIKTKADVDTLYAFFMNRYGKEGEFLVKDPGDFQIGPLQNIGTGDGSDTTFQIVKKYTDSSSNVFTRNIKRFSLSDPGEVKVNGVAQTYTTHYTLDPATGIITFVTPPTVGHPITVTLQYYRLARFDIDQFPNQVLLWDGSSYTLNQLPALPIVEIRE